MKKITACLAMLTILTAMTSCGTSGNSSDSSATTSASATSFASIAAETTGASNASKADTTTSAAGNTSNNTPVNANDNEKTEPATESENNGTPLVRTEFNLIAGIWYEEGVLDSRTLTIDADGSYELAYRGGGKEYGNIKVEVQDIDGTHSNTWYKFYSGDTEWASFRLAARENDSPVLCSGFDENSLVFALGGGNGTDSSATQPNEYGFYTVTSDPRPGTAGPVLTSLTGTFSDGNDIYTFYDCSSYDGKFSVKYADGTTLDGYVKVQYLIQSDNYKEYWYVLYDNSSKLAGSFRFMGDNPLNELNDGMRSFTRIN